MQDLNDTDQNLQHDPLDSANTMAAPGDNPPLAAQPYNDHGQYPTPQQLPGSEEDADEETA